MTTEQPGLTDEDRMMLRNLYLRSQKPAFEPIRLENPTKSQSLVVRFFWRCRQALKRFAACFL